MDQDAPRALLITFPEPPTPSVRPENAEFDLDTLRSNPIDGDAVVHLRLRDVHGNAF
jgi:hypothetical protein